MERRLLAPLGLALGLATPATGCRAVISGALENVIEKKLGADTANCKFRGDNIHCEIEEDGVSVTLDANVRSETIVYKMENDLERTQCISPEGENEVCNTTVLDPDYANEIRHEIIQMGGTCTGDTVKYIESDGVMTVTSC